MRPALLLNLNLVTALRQIFREEGLIPGFLYRGDDACHVAQRIVIAHR